MPLWFTQEASDSTVRILVGNKVDLLEPREAEECFEKGRSMSMTVTRFPERVPTAAAIQIAQVRSHIY